MQVDVLDPTTGSTAFTCGGPGSYGQCAREPAAEALPCEGCILQTRSGPGRLDGFRFVVGRSSLACPLRSLLPGLR
ncbi:MAG: hypothetical protein WCD35_01195 [Mycobacteriales bacterium]